MLFDTEAIRSAPREKTEDDIVIAITFLQEFLDSVFLASLPGGGILTTFLFESISHRRRSDHFIAVGHEHTGNLPELIELLAHEYLFPDVYAADMLRSYATLVFMELIRALYYQAQISDPISNIANTSYFYRKFEMFYHMTPRAYRKALADAHPQRSS